MTVFPFLSYFILGERLKGQKADTKGWEMSGIKIHGIKDTKNK